MGAIARRRRTPHCKKLLKEGIKNYCAAEFWDSLAIRKELGEYQWGDDLMRWFCRFYIPKLDEPKLQIPDVHGEGNGRGPGDHSSPHTRQTSPSL